MFKLKSPTENVDDITNYRKQLIPDAFTIQGFPSAAGFESWINTLITMVHAASHGIDAAREWIAVVKRDPNIDKYQSAAKIRSSRYQARFSTETRFDQKATDPCQPEGARFGIDKR